MQRRRILIVEDEAVTSVMLEKTLKELGYDVVGSAFDSQEAINLAEEKRPDLILMDIRIQGEMDGIDAAKMIYQKYDIPIIYLTAHSDDDTIQRAVESGPFGYLIKPFKDRELYSNIEMTIHKHKLYLSSAAPKISQVEKPELEPAQPVPIPQLAPKSPDLRLGILAVQTLPHPVLLFSATGAVMFMNNTSKIFIKNELGKPASTIQSISDLPDLMRSVWQKGQERFRGGHGISIAGPVALKGGSKRFKIDMIPLLEKGNLLFISSIILPGENSGSSVDYGVGMQTLLDEAIHQLKEIRFLSSTEDTYRLRLISLSTYEALKRLKDLRSISYPSEKEKASSQILTR